MKRREIEMLIKSADQIPRVQQWVGTMAEKGLPGGPVAVRLGRERRTLDQNAHVHPIVRAIKRHMEAHGAPKRKESWWRYYLLGKYSGTEMTPDPAGGRGYVVINHTVGTSDLRKDEAAEFIDWLYAFGVDIGVDWSKREQKIINEHGTAK